MAAWLTPDPIALHARAVPEKIACVDLASGREWNYRDLDRAIAQASGYLARDLAIQAGQRIATIARNSADLMILQQAAMRIGAIFVPLNWRLSRSEQADILADCGPVLVVTDEDDSSINLPRGCRALQVSQFAEASALAQRLPEMARPPADAPIVILYTSGTTGRPKGVMITGANMFATAVNFGILGHVGHESVFLCDTPMFHVIGLITSIQAPLMQGGQVLISSGFDPGTTNARLADDTLAVTHYFCVPQMAQALRQAPNFQPHRWKTLKALFTGGAPNPPSNINWWLDQGIRMVDGYGMTEAGTLLGMPLDLKLISAKAGSAGLPPPALSLRIADAEGGEVPPGSVGEIQVSGPNVTPGYWAKPEETAKVMTPDGWLRTGDLARRDGDGYVTIVDRRKDMFISGGENVYPVEVEQALMEHPSVVEAAVIGVADERWGEVGHAFVVLRGGLDADAASLAAFCASRIARYKVPKEFIAIERLPRNGAGKALKDELRAMLAVERDNINR